MNLPGLLRTATRRLLAAWHGGCGRLAYRLGRSVASRRHFERVLDLEGDVFAAYVHLGKLAWQVGDYSGYRREFEHALQIDPERYSRLRHPFELFEPPGRAPSEEAGERATWRSVRPGGNGQGPRGTIHRVDLPTDAADVQGMTRCEPFTDLGADSPRQRLFGDDFGSQAERARFLMQKPISRTDIAAADIDELCRLL